MLLQDFPGSICNDSKCQILFKVAIFTIRVETLSYKTEKGFNAAGRESI